MDKLQRLQQKTMSLEEYRQKMELYMMRASIRESESTTIARFLNELNLEIRDRVGLLPYQDLNDLVQSCIKVEQQNLRKTSSCREGSYPNSYPKREFKREESVPEEKICSLHLSALGMSSALNVMEDVVYKLNARTKELCF